MQEWNPLSLCAASIVLALVVGRDPALQAPKQAKARGEEMARERGPVLSD